MGLAVRPANPRHSLGGRGGTGDHSADPDLAWQAGLCDAVPAAAECPRVGRLSVRTVQQAPVVGNMGGWLAVRASETALFLSPRASSTSI